MAFGAVSRRCFAVVLLLLWTACATGNVQGLIERKQVALMPLSLAIASFEQTLALAITAALFVSLIGWAYRHWKNADATSAAEYDDGIAEKV